MDEISYIDPHELKPVHEEGERQFYTKHVDEIVESMLEEVSFGVQRGWSGRPLLVLQHPDGTLQALTGSHRITAARKAEIPAIPCYLIELENYSGEEWAQELADERIGHNDQDRLNLIKQSGDEIAIAIMYDELRVL